MKLDETKNSRKNHFGINFISKFKEFLKKKISVRILIIVLIMIITPVILIIFNNHLLNTKKYQMNSESSLGVKELIQKVKRELQDAQRERMNNNESALFKLNSFEMEISFVVQSKFVENIGFQYDIVTVGSDYQLSTDRIQKIKLQWGVIPSQKKSGEGVLSSDLIGEVPASTFQQIINAKENENEQPE